MGKLNMPKVERYIGATLARGVILLVEDDDLPMATMGLRVQDFWWSDDTALVDAFTYVAPEGRKTSAFRMMFRKAKEMANNAHMPSHGELRSCGRRKKIKVVQTHWQTNGDDNHNGRHKSLFVEVNDGLFLHTILR